MFIQVTLLRKRQVTLKLLSIRAYKWSFLRVDSQVIIEIVPLSEIHRTTRMVTLQDFQESLSVRIFEFKDSKGSCTWNVIFRILLTSNQILVRLFHITALNNLDFITAWWYLLFDTLIIYLIPCYLASHHCVFVVVSAKKIFDISPEQVILVQVFPHGFNFLSQIMNFGLMKNLLFNIIPLMILKLDIILKLLLFFTWCLNFGYSLLISIDIRTIL